MKSERLKKLELELSDLERWLLLDLVPKKDIENHKREIDELKNKIEEEKNKISAMRDDIDGEDLSLTRKSRQSRQAYQEANTIPGVDIEDGGGSITDANVNTEAEHVFNTKYTTVSDNYTSEETTTIVKEDDDPFSDKNRWRRGILEDPDVDSW